MAIFQRKANFLGIDVGTSSVKVVELRAEGGRPRVVTYAYVEETADIIKSDAPQARARLVQILQRVMKEGNVTTQQAIAALPSFAVFTSIISLPSMSEKDLVAAVRWEAKKFVPLPIEDMILDWRIVRETKEDQAAAATVAKATKQQRKEQERDKKKRDLKVLLTAAPRSLVQRYVSVFKEAGIALASLETESFALERSLIGTDPSPIMVVDIGALATEISVIARGIPILTRSIDVGGATITKAIMNSMNIDVDRAEQFKRDFGLMASQGNQQVPKTIEFILGQIVNESRYCLNLYQGQGVADVEKVILSGGSSFLPALPEYLARVLNLKVFIGDPWARIIYPRELQSALQEIGPRFSVAIGLALRNLVA